MGISVVSPPEGSVIGRTVPLVIDVTSAIALRRVVISAVLGDNIIEEMVHNGIDFAGPYSTNSRSAITDGYRYTLLRVGGWRASSVTLRILAIDTAGTVTQKTLAIPQSLYSWVVAV